MPIVSGKQSWAALLFSELLALLLLDLIASLTGWCAVGVVVLGVEGYFWVEEEVEEGKGVMLKRVDWEERWMEVGMEMRMDREMEQ